MITYQERWLDNGLRVLLHRDMTTPFASVSILYNVGARDEDPQRTGFAHLFEHLMFGGTPEVPDYDLVVNSVGGEDNAFTNNDYTNYYLTLPSQYVERALWLEADRMQHLDISAKSLQVQQQVVTEEYHQRYVNQPYGDAMMLLRPLCYQRHPYRWCTIGSSIKHVQEATLGDVRRFHDTFYRPDNAILAIAGSIDPEVTMRQVAHYFAPVGNAGLPMPPAASDKPMAFARKYPAEDEQRSQRRITVQRQVPNDALYMAFPMCSRADSDFYVYDLLSDVLSNGNSSRLYRRLVKERPLFTELNAFITGEADCGLFMIVGKLQDEVTLPQAEEAVWQELNSLQQQCVSEHELQKVINKFENTFVYGQYKAMDRAMSLCYYSWLGRVEMINDEPSYYKKVQVSDLMRVARQCFCPEKASIMYYQRQEH